MKNIRKNMSITKLFIFASMPETSEDVIDALALYIYCTGLECKTLACLFDNIPVYLGKGSTCSFTNLHIHVNLHMHGI